MQTLIRHATEYHDVSPLDQISAAFGRAIGLARAAMRKVPLIWVVAGVVAGLLAAALPPPPPPIVPKVVIFEAKSAVLSTGAIEARTTP